MPEIEGFFVRCYECSEEVKVGPGTFRRVLAQQSWVICEHCTAMATHCSELVGNPSLAGSVKKPADRFTV